nr:MAG TPA: hypothetical protein [Caudoviricetes sp.]
MALVKGCRCTSVNFSIVRAHKPPTFPPLCIGITVRTLCAP